MSSHPDSHDMHVEILGEAPCLSVEDLAHACRMQTTWVVERLSTGLLHGELHGGQWRCTGATVLRARRLARFETTFDADPELAALTTDLVEEVAQLRQRLRQLQAQFNPRG